MFEQQQVTIKSGEGDNYFEATSALPEDASPSQITAVMSGLREMQKDRMEWASQKAQKPQGA